MTAKNQAVRLNETYCPYCHLSTRADYQQCLHCRKPLKTSFESRVQRNRRESDGRSCHGTEKRYRLAR
jgi:hypothetical protein